MLDTQTAITWRGHELIDRDGERIGRITEIYLDAETDEPEWATVKTGLFGTRQTFVPIRDATSEGEIVRVPFEKSHVRDAPTVDAEQQLSHAEERELYEHYGVAYGAERSASQLPQPGGSPGQEPVGDESASPSAGDEREEREERGHDRAPTPEEGERGVAVPGESDQDDEDTSPSAGERRVEAGATTERVAEEPFATGGGETRLRLKRYVVTEEVRVPVQREEVRVERED